MVAFRYEGMKRFWGYGAKTQVLRFLLFNGPMIKKGVVYSISGYLIREGKIKRGRISLKGFDEKGNLFPEG